MADHPTDSLFDIVSTTVDKIRPHLADKDAAVQGAILADLLAIWIAGHIVHGDRIATDEVRSELLERHFDTVRELVEITIKIIDSIE